MDNLTSTLDDAQLKQNIDALQKQGVSNLKIQDYVNNYTKSSTGGYVLKTAPKTNLASTVTDTATPFDAKLSNMPGTLGFIGSGIYNAGKGLLKLGGSAVADVFQAVNHPIDSFNTVKNFLGGELAGGAPPETLDTLGGFVQGTVGSKGLLGIAQEPGRVASEAMRLQENEKNAKLAEEFANLSLVNSQKAKAETDPVRKQRYLDIAKNLSDSSIELNQVNQKPEVTQGQIAGTTLNGALTALTFGEGNLGAQAIEKSVENGLMTKTTGQFLKNFATSFAGRSAQSAGIMGGFQVGSNLQEGLPVTTGLKEAIGAGLALPGVLQGAGKVINKVTPSSLTPDAGADMLKKTIGFRGFNANPKAKTMFDNAVPVVYKDLVDSGFKVADATDPNNLINLDKAVQDRMTKILEERTKRIQATGGDATISGDLASEKIRNLVEPGSVEDLTNPNVRERLDLIAKNFEGKRYTPVEAQKAIIQANSGFSLADNPAMARQIKMAISEAFTPELDRLVAGVEKVVRDEKGRVVPAVGGTAELNKKWSALKTFKDQLEKKLTMEERKAQYDLPTRLTNAEIAGKAGEIIGNPLKATEKLVGGSFEYIANRVMGDRNNVNYRIYKAFNGQPMGEAVVGLLNKFSRVSDLVRFLEQNPLIKHLLEKILPTDPTLIAKENLIPNSQGGFIRLGDTYSGRTKGFTPGRYASDANQYYVSNFPKDMELSAKVLLKNMQNRGIGASNVAPDSVLYDLKREAVDAVQRSKDLVEGTNEKPLTFQEYFDKKINEIRQQPIPEDNKIGIDKEIYKPIKEATPAKDLSPEYRAIENKAFNSLKSDPAGMVEAYNKLPETKGGKIANADTARKVFTKDGYNGINSPAVQEPASALNKVIYREGLKNPGDAVLYAGGSGTGKTSAIKGLMPEVLDSAGVILDGNFSNLKSAMDRLKEAHDAGKEAHIVYVYRDPVGAWTEGVIKRMKENKSEGGRVVPASVVAKNMVDSYNVVSTIADRILENKMKDVRISFIDNSLGKNNASMMSNKKFNHITYPPVEKLTETFRNEAKKLYDSKKITEQEYKALIK